jgi:hypothetical protein
LAVLVTEKRRIVRKKQQVAINAIEAGNEQGGTLAIAVFGARTNSAEVLGGPITAFQQFVPIK